MTPCSDILRDLLGWGAGLFGLFGSLLLVRPLFLLQEAREALEEIVYARDNQKLEGNATDAQAASKVFRDELFRNRKRWKKWVWGGVASPSLALLLLVLQFPCLG